MDKAKLTKIVVKGVIGLSVSTIIGSMIKMEKTLGTQIDEAFGNKTSN